jgi:hypothetical protein
VQPVLQITSSGTQSESLLERGVSYTDARKKRSRYAVPVCVLLRKIFRNAVPSQKKTLVLIDWFNLAQDRVKCLLLYTQ